MDKNVWGEKKKVEKVKHFLFLHHTLALIGGA
jgi:hypothetical protein